MAGHLTPKDRMITWFVWCLARSIACTLRVQTFGEEILNELRPDKGESLILVGWHGGTFIPITRYRGRGYWAMISTSRDGDRQNQLFHRFGFRTVRGSTSARGAVESVIAMRRELKAGGVLAHTPDGPRGPRGVVHPGAIYIAQKAQCPLLPAGVSAWPRWNLSTWDRYCVPKPFARGVIMYGSPIPVPKDLDDDGRKAFAEAVGARIQKLQDCADEFVRTGRVPESYSAQISSSASLFDTAMAGQSQGIDCAQGQSVVVGATSGSKETRDPESLRSRSRGDGIS